MGRAMAGSKRSGESSGGGAGEVSPLTAQLQQAWLKTQMPKAQKRSFIPVANTQNQPSRMAPSSALENDRPSGLSTPSARSALSSLFPELANVQEEKKAMISSVFEDGTDTAPRAEQLRRKKTNECLGYLFGEIEYPKIAKPKAVDAPFERSYSDSVIQGSSTDSFCMSGPFSTSHSFSESSHQNVDVAEYETATEVQQEKTPMFEYITDILMDENVEEKKCMFQEMSALQAMAKDLGDLISFDLPSESVAEFSSSDFQSNLDLQSPSDFQSPSEFQSNVEFLSEEDSGGVDSWINEILDGPPPAELRDISDAKAELGYKSAQCLEEPVCSHADSGLGCTTSWTEGKDADGECQSAYAAYCESSLSPMTSADSPNGNENENGNGSSSHFESKAVALIANGNGVPVSVPSVDLTNLLLRCAQAVEQSDYGHANQLVHELRLHTSPYGNANQRLAHYFMEALVARMSGTGGQLYSALNNNRPSEGKMLKAQILLCEYCPFTQVPHSFANHAIMEAFKGASRVHVIDYGILYGVQWPCLLHQLSQREGGPPHLRITGIDRPQPGFRPSERIRETGRRLAKLAKQMQIPFEFHAIAEKWDAITPANLMLRDDEVLAVNCLFRLRHLLDESVTAASPRNLLLSRIRSLNPKVFVEGVLNAGYNAPFFMSRFREALAHFSTAFDMMETVFPPEHEMRLTVDQEIIGREILNVVACEGLERVERTETYRQWQARTMRAGFQQKPNSRDIISKIRVAMQSYHRDFGIGEDGNWFLLGWKERITHAVTAWEPIPESP